MTAFCYALLDLSCVLLGVVVYELHHPFASRWSGTNFPYLSRCQEPRTPHSHKQHTNVSDISDNAR